MYYDADMFLKILIAIIPLFQYNAIRVLLTSKNIETKDIESLRGEDLVNSKNENDPFYRLEVLLNNKIICLVNFENYSSIGGPAPYHDNFIFSFYSDDYDKIELIDRINKIVETEAFHLDNIFYGKALPEISLITKLKRFLK